MSVYELTFLLTDKEELKTLKEHMSASQAQVVAEESWGQKRLAYPIKKQKIADFYNWKVELSEGNVKTLREKLRYDEKVLRYLLLKVDDAAPTKAASKKK